MPRAIWKGAISFGLVHVPVSLHTAVKDERIDFDWLDKRSMDRVGYKRVNKVTGKDIDKDDVVKGVEYEKGRYVVISEAEIRKARPKATQTIDIFSFVKATDIPLQHFDTPYYLSPDKRGGKVYALLRETLQDTGKVALATLVLHTRQHLALLRPLGDALVLITLRWPDEVRSFDTLELDASVAAPKLQKQELAMAKRLVEDMSGPWSPDDYHDAFRDTIMQLVEEKARKGKLSAVKKAKSSTGKGAHILDLTEMLKRSLAGNTAAKKLPAKKTPARAVVKKSGKRTHKAS
ncbi:Ku protein [Pseudomonas cremoricolorata]|uniref:Non-homologous end joining protein Ku n=1 Tax=Pseudomonas cremoricolorata TaxID=157783 RepID=A0A089YGY4_9PSED|nr:Ku protein [Pseudomonas cremoricolorata]AIR90973.1 DNA repair protein [Pseudomonas cremoricolorata]